MRHSVHSQPALGSSNSRFSLGETMGFCAAGQAVDSKGKISQCACSQERKDKKSHTTVESSLGHGPVRDPSVGHALLLFKWRGSCRISFNHDGGLGNGSVTQRSCTGVRLLFLTPGTNCVWQGWWGIRKGRKERSNSIMKSFYSRAGYGEPSCYPKTLKVEARKF